MSLLLLPDSRELVRAYTQTRVEVTDLVDNRVYVRRLPGKERWPMVRINSASGRAIDPVPHYADQPIIFVTVFGWVAEETYDYPTDSPLSATSEIAATLRNVLAEIAGHEHDGAVATGADLFSSIRDLDDTSFGVPRPALQFDFRLTYHAASPVGS